jgi:hypothetical protein
MRPRPSAKIALTAVATLFAAGVVGYLIGHGNRGAAFVVRPGIVYAGSNEGTAYLGADQPLDRQPSGFAYFFPPNLAWIDATGSLHSGGRPTCVPMYHAVHVKQMEAIKYPIGGGYMGTVLWVRC